MSRSKRKPIWTEGLGGKRRTFEKNKANKRVRRSKDLSQGKGYKKVYSSWDICDYKFYDPKSPKVRRK